MVKQLEGAPDKKRPKTAATDGVEVPVGGEAAARGPLERDVEMAVVSSNAATAATEPKEKGATKGKGKGRGGSGGRNALGVKEMEKMVMDMNKLLLSHDDSIMALESIQLRTFIVPSASTAMEAGKREGQNYHDRVTSLSKEELKKANLGPPHVYIALAVLKDLARAHPTESDELAHLKEFISRMEAGSHEACTTIIPVFKIGKTYEEDFKVRFHCQLSPDSNCLSSFLLKEEGVEKVGKAPRGKLARDCQKWMK